MKLSIRNNTNALQKRGDKKNSNVLRTLVLALNNSCRKNFLKIGLKLKTTFQIALDKNIQTRKDYRQLVGRLFRK